MEDYIDNQGKRSSIPPYVKNRAYPDVIRTSIGLTGTETGAVWSSTGKIEANVSAVGADIFMVRLSMRIAWPTTSIVGLGVLRTSTGMAKAQVGMARTSAATAGASFGAAGTSASVAQLTN